jgi:hypothetical protein
MAFFCALAINKSSGPIYYHNVQRFSPIFCEKNWRFKKKQCCDINFGIILLINAILRQFSGEIIFKTIASVPAFLRVGWGGAGGDERIIHMFR